MRPGLLPHEAPGPGQLDLAVSWSRRHRDEIDRNDLDRDELRLSGELGLRGLVYAHVSHPIAWLRPHDTGGTAATVRGFGDLSLGGGLRGVLGGDLHARLALRVTVPTSADVIGRADERIESRLHLARAWIAGSEHVRLWLWGGGGAIRRRTDDRTDALLHAGGAVDVWICRRAVVLAIAEGAAVQAYPAQIEDHLSTSLGGRIAGCLGAVCLSIGMARGSSEPAVGGTSRSWMLAIGSRASLAEPRSSTASSRP